MAPLCGVDLPDSDDARPETLVAWHVDHQGVAWLTLNRPARGNALVQPMCARLVQLVARSDLTRLRAGRSWGRRVDPGASTLARRGLQPPAEPPESP